jgi:hypothetical protein
MQRFIGMGWGELKKLLHDGLGFAASSMVVAALVFFLSPWIETVLGPDRTKTLKIILVGVFAIYALIFSIRLLGSMPWRKD